MFWELLKFDLGKLNASFVIVLVSIIIPITNRNSQLFINYTNVFASSVGVRKPDPVTGP